MVVGSASDLYVAQPVTFASMLKAAEVASEHSAAEIELLSAQFPEDRSIVPSEFKLTPDLDRSILDVDDFGIDRKLPFLADILQRLFDNSDADWLIFTNVDIALVPHFYVTVSKVIDEGYEAFVINRRTISDRFTSPSQLEEMCAEKGEAHGGYDCFVFNRRLYPRIELGQVAVGLPKLGRSLLINLEVHASHFAIFRHEHLTFHIGNARSNRNPRMAKMRKHNQAEYRRLWKSLRPAHPELDAWKPRELDIPRYLVKRVVTSTSIFLRKILPPALFEKIHNLYESIRREPPERPAFDARVRDL